MTRRFTLGGSRTYNDGALGLGTVTGGIYADGQTGHVTTLFGVVDGLHATPHNGTDISRGAGSALYSGPFESTVAQLYCPTWQGPGTKTLFDYIDPWATIDPSSPDYEDNYIDAAGNRHRRKIILPGEPDRGGNVILLLYKGPFLLADGSRAEYAAQLICHLLELPTHISVGDTLAPRSYIAREGSTGYSTGAHAHVALAFLRDLNKPFPPDMSNWLMLDSALDYIGVPMEDVPDHPPPPPPFETPVAYAANGAALTVFAGGTVADLEAAAMRAEANGVWAQDASGVYRLLIVGGPAFINETFRAAFPDGFAGPTSLVLWRGGF